MCIEVVSMKVNVAQLLRAEGASAHYDLQEEFPPFQFDGDDLVFESPVHVTLKVSNSGKELLASGRIQTQLRAHCSRCLEEMSYPLDLEYEDEWVSTEKATEDQLENALLFDKEQVELDERILEQIVLSLPMKFTCKPDCKGLCSHCGTNLNLGECSCSEDDIDPRLAALAKWHPAE